MDAIVTTQATELILFDPQSLDQHPAAVYIGGLNSKRSQATQRQSLAVVAELLTGSPDILSCNWSALRFQHTARIRSELAGRYAPATANKILCALRGVLKAAWRLGYMTAEDYYRARDVEGVTGETLPAGRALVAREITAILAACVNDPTPAGARDAALFVTLYPGGLRRDEVVGLDLEDYDPETGALAVRHGKRNKARGIFIRDIDAKLAISDWLEIRGSEPGPLFWPVNKGGNPQPRRMTNQAVYNMLAKRGRQAGVKDFSPHDLRRSVISDMLDEGGDIEFIQKFAGHKSVNTTLRYSRRDERGKVKVAELLHVVYPGRRLVF